MDLRFWITSLTNSGLNCIIYIFLNLLSNTRSNMKNFFLIALVALIFSACAPVYVPNSRNSPMFTKAGEFQGSIQFGNGIDAQGAVSVTNHIGLMGNFSYANNKSPDPDDN